MPTPTSPDNSSIITWVIRTVCLLAIIGVAVEGACAVFQIPDMSGALSSGFTHVVDTIVGALIALLINTRAASNPPPPPKDTPIPPVVEEH